MLETTVRMYTARALTIPRLAHELSLSYWDIVSLFNNLRLNGIFVAPEFALDVIGIRYMFVFLNAIPCSSLQNLSIDTIPYLRSVVYFYPNITMLAFEVSECQESMYPTICVTRRYRRRPTLQLLYAYIRKDFEAIMRYDFSEKTPVLDVKKPRISWIEFEIIDYLERKPDMWLSELQELVGIKRKKVLIGHLENLEKAVRGYAIFRLDVPSPKHVLIQLQPYKDPDETCRHLITSPFVSTCLTASDNTVLVQLYIPTQMMQSLWSILGNIPGDILSILVTDPMFRVLKKHVSKRTGEYDPRTRSLREVSIDDIVKMMFEKGFLRPTPTRTSVGIPI